MGKGYAKTAAGTAEPIEAELRLVGDPEVLNAVFASSCMALQPGAEEKVSELETRYFDTTGQDLRAQGLAFRVRADGSGYRQTLKAGDDAKAALLKRHEWEMALEDGEPRPDALPKAARRTLPDATFEDGLEQAFVTRMHRRVREVAIDGKGRIEAALDLGEIETRVGGLPVAELELELLEGQPETLYHLALELQKFGPLHLETRSKSARAYDRLAGKPPGWQRASPPLLGPADSVDDAMAAIFDSCFSQWLANQAAAIDGRDPEGVHQMRVALRRLRSALSVFGKLIPKSQLAWLEPGAKRAIDALGPARDWDVFQAELLAPVIEARPGDADLPALRTRARARRRAGYRQARKHLESADYTRFVLRVGAWLERRAWREVDDEGQAAVQAQPIRGFAGKLLSRRHKSVRKKGRGFADLSTERRHKLRIALKKFRYCIEFFEPLFDKKSVKPCLGSAKVLQDRLGHLNDVAVAETLMAEILARRGRHDVKAAAGLVIGWHAHAVAAVEPELRQAWKSFAAEPAFWP